MKNCQAYHKVELREVDALRNTEGVWTWNETYVLADDIIFCEEDFTPRKILRKLREWGYLSPESKGQVRVVREDILVEIQEKSTGRPILALLVYETRRIVTAIAPAHWASFLFNGDRSVWEYMPDPEDEAECLRMEKELGSPVDCEEVGFCWNPDYGRAGECCEYKFIARPE